MLFVKLDFKFTFREERERERKRGRDVEPPTVSYTTKNPKKSPAEGTKLCCPYISHIPLCRAIN
jgi:hypothetical protein